jgi:hypothetical protein
MSFHFQATGTNEMEVDAVSEVSQLLNQPLADTSAAEMVSGRSDEKGWYTVRLALVCVIVPVCVYSPLEFGENGNVKLKTGVDLLVIRFLQAPEKYQR